VNPNDWSRRCFTTFIRVWHFGEEGQIDRVTTCRWIIDPLDGTTNYTTDTRYSASRCLEKQGEIVVGVVYNPILNELYAAEKGKGTRMRTGH
jgi:fructose-1,6-bisphosphatase/inositol monophosphatase family enzyme